MKTPKDPEIEALLENLKDDPQRDPRASVQGKAKFLAQAHALAQDVSPQPNWRHMGWIKNYFERMIPNMKTPLKTIAWTSITLLTVVAIFLAAKTTPVSAQQILERASEAQASAEAVAGILHNRVQIYQNPGVVEGEGNTTITDDYFDYASGYYRSETRDENGNLINISATDGTYSYYAPVVDERGTTVIERTPVENKQPASTNTDEASDETSTPAQRNNVTATTHAAFDQFNNNPRVEVEEEKTWTDGSPVYVLVNRSYQTQKTSEGSTDGFLTGTTRMVFNKETYQLLQIETTVHVDDKDILIQKVDFLLTETLPADSVIVWDLSDLENVSFVDASKSTEREVITDTLTRHELAQHTQAYVLDPIPAGFSEEILAIDYESDEAYDSYEIHYRNADDGTFSMQAIGALETNFVEENFYDGSYMTTSGLVLYFSPSSSEDSTSAMLAAPDGNGFLLFADMSREEVTNLAETLVLAQ